MGKSLSGRKENLAFLLVLRAIAQSEREAGLDKLDHADRSVLYHIALSEGSGEAVKVTDLDKGGVFGTRPTVLARVARLIEQGWVEKDINPDDARSRVISVTSRTRTFFRKASRAVTAAIGG